MITLITAASRNSIIGIEGSIPWHLKTDLQLFKEITVGHPILMGRKTFDSIGGHGLQDRYNIVLSRTLPYTRLPSLLITDSMDEAINYADDAELFVIGGEQIYRQTIGWADKIILTEVDVIIGKMEQPAFPIIGDEWKLVSEIPFPKSKTNQYRTVRKTFVKEKKNKCL